MSVDTIIGVLLLILSVGLIGYALVILNHAEEMLDQARAHYFAAAMTDAVMPTPSNQEEQP